MKILSRRFLASYLTFYLAILFASILVISIVEMMLNFDDFLDSSDGFLGLGTYLFLRIPTYYLSYLAPFASFGAAFLAFALPARVHEILALQAGGISPQVIATPLLGAAALVAAATLLLNETWVLDVSRTLHAQKSHDEEEQLFQARSSFWYRKGAFLYNVRSADRESRSLYGVEVFERTRAGELLRRISASSAQILPDGAWRLRDATIRRFDTGRPESAPTTHIASEIDLELGTRGDLALLNADPQALSLLRLRAYIDALSRDGRDAKRPRLLFHSRLTEPISVVLFALLGLPLGFGVCRQGIAFAALQGLGVVGLFYTARALAILSASSGPSAAAPATWLVVGAFAGYGTWRFLRMGR